MTRSILLLELNEVPLRVINYYLEKHPDGLLAREWRNIDSRELVSQDVGHLSPWVTWPSVHRGVNDEKHGIRFFGQSLEEVNREYPPLWEILAASGVKTGVFGSLQSYPPPCKNVGSYSFFVPDTFAAGEECLPADISVFQRLNLSMVDASTRNVSRGIPVRHALTFMRKAASLGIRASTLAAAAAQVCVEFVKPARKVRRRTFQSVLAFDIFLHSLEKTKPQFASFFTNHVASSMHRYWAATFPGDYQTLEFTPEWIKEYGGEIDYAMGYAEKFIGELMAFCRRNPEYLLVVASGMGQAAIDGSMVRTQLVLTNPAPFMRMFGVPDDQWVRHRAMAPQFSCEVSEACRDTFRRNLEAATICGDKAEFTEKEKGYFCIQLGKTNVPDDECTLECAGKQLPFSESGLENLLIDDQVGSTAYHVPNGSMLVFDPQRQGGKRYDKPYPALDLAPAILRLYGLAIPGYMNPSPASF